MGEPRWRREGTRLAPGVYEHGDEVHVDAAELCAHFGVPNTERNFQMIVRAVFAEAGAMGVEDVRVVDD